MEPTAPTSWAQLLAGPLGGLIAVLSVGYLVLTGKLRLNREVVDLRTQLSAEKARGDKWEQLALELLSTNARAIQVAQSAVQVSEKR
jgi:cell division protein FtsL